MAEELNGVIIINKHKGVTSHDIVFKIRKLFNTRKVGHTGTLDPMAEGVLPVLIGRAAKAAEYLTAEDKGYTAEIQLGITTDTEDTSGKILTKSDTLPAKNDFFEACKKFTGDIKQIPPMYSALKVNGQKLCDLARNGIEIEREARPIHIFAIIPEEVDEKAGIYKMDVSCSKGTYMRTLCADIGAHLGCGGAMSKLLRTKSGNFTLDQSHTISELEKISYEDRCRLIIPTEELFSDYDKVFLSDFYSRLAKSGCEIYQSKIKTAHPVDKFVTMWDKKGFFALGQVKQYEGGTAIKAVKLFVI